MKGFLGVVATICIVVAIGVGSQGGLNIDLSVGDVDVDVTIGYEKDDQEKG